MGDDTYDLDVALKEAAERFREKVRRDPGELWKRLERRKTGMLSRPLRAWCLAVRAGDRRINGMTAAIEPIWGGTGEEGTEAHRHEGTEGGGPRGGTKCWKVGEKVVLDARLLRWLCRPVRIPFPGLPAREVGRLLGCHRSVVMEAAKKGALDVKRIKGLDGVRGWVPVVYAERYLDPSAGNLHRMADPLWGTSCRFLSDRVPDHVEQVVKRVPYWHQSMGKFMGWKWVCPGCQRLVNLLFYPMPPLVQARILLPEGMGERVKWRMGEGENGRTDEAPGTFACRECHRLVFFSRASADAWNLFISRVTGGMLYGSEVERPGDFPEAKEVKGCGPDERNAHAAFVVKKFRHRKKRRGPAVMTERRKRVREMTVEGRTRLEMAVELGCSVDAIKEDIKRVRAFHGVKTREELAEKLGRKVGVHLNPRARRVMEMLVEGKGYEEIAGELGVTYAIVAQQAMRVYEAHGVEKGHGRRERFIDEMRRGKSEGRGVA